MNSKFKPCLPFGWVVKQSSSYPDRVYYFNTQTGASTWDMPELIKTYLKPSMTQQQGSPAFTEGKFSLDSDQEDATNDQLDLTSHQQTDDPSKLNLASLQPKKRDSIHSAVNPVTMKSPSKDTLAASSAASVKSVGSSIENVHRGKPKPAVKLPNTLKKIITSKATKDTSSTPAGEPVCGKSPVFNKNCPSRPVLTQTDMKNSKNKIQSASFVVKTVYNPPDILDGTPVPQNVSFNSNFFPPRKRERTFSNSSTDNTHNVTLSNASRNHVESPNKSKRLKLSKGQKPGKASCKSTKTSDSGDISVESENLTMTVNILSDTRKVFTSSESLATSAASINKNISAKDNEIPGPSSSDVDPTKQQDAELEKQKSIQKWIDHLEPEDKLTECIDLLHPPIPPPPLCIGQSVLGITSFSDNRKVILSDKSRNEVLQEVPSFSSCDVTLCLPGSSGVHSPRKLELAKKSASNKNLWRGVHSKPSTSITQREIVDMEVDDLPTTRGENREIEDMDVCDIALKEVRMQLAKFPNEVMGKLTESVHDVAPSKHERTIQSLQIVIDTNVLISNLGFVEDLRDEDFEGLGRPLLVIPWTVMQELDALKDNKKKNLSFVTAKKARAPVDFLYNCFQNKHPRIIGQTPKQAKEAVKELEAVNNDDRILQCCLQRQRNNPECHIVLLTNDKNLCSKASITGIRVFSRQNIVSGLKHLGGIPAKGVQGLQEKDQLTKSKRETKPVHTESLPGLNKVADDIMCKSRTVLKTAFAVVLEKEMKVAYDDIWEDIVYRKPPWSLEDVLDSFKKHWIAVFGHILNRKLQKNVERLVDKFKPFKGFVSTLESVHELLTDAMEILDECCKHRSYSIEFKESHSVLKSILQYVEELKDGKIVNQSLDNFLMHNSKVNTLQQNRKKRNSTKTEIHSTLNQAAVSSCPSLSPRLTSIVSPVTTDNTTSDPGPAEKRFQEVWSAINKICFTLQTWISSDGYEKETITVLNRLVPTMKTLRFHFDSALQIGPKELGNTHVVNLTEELNSFFCKVDLEDSEEKINVEDVYKLLCMEDKRPLLQGGLQQLDSMLRQVFGFVHTLPD